MAKKNAVNLETHDEPYIVDEGSTPKASGKIAGFFKSRAGKTTAIAAGSALALGAAFGVGFSAGNVNHPGFDGQRFGQAQQPFGDHDGDRGGHGNFGPRDGQQPGSVQGQQNFDRDGDGPHGPAGVAPAPNGQLPAPNSTTGSATTAP